MNRFFAHLALTLPTAILLAVMLLPAAPAQAAITSDSGALSQALSSDSDAILFARKENRGFKLSSSFFSGRASGSEVADRGISSLGVLGEFSTDRFAELEGDQRVYALMLDGSYKFDTDLGVGLPLNTYLGGGFGMAMTDQKISTNRLGSAQGGDTVPLFRVGGGISYKLDKGWDLSLNYKAGFAGGDTTTFTGRNQNDQVDLQMVDIGMKFKF